jgi:hypothetical protein
MQMFLIYVSSVGGCARRNDFPISTIIGHARSSRLLASAAWLRDQRKSILSSQDRLMSLNHVPSP